MAIKRINKESISLSRDDLLELKIVSFFSFYVELFLFVPEIIKITNLITSLPKLDCSFVWSSIGPSICPSIYSIYRYSSFGMKMTKIFFPFFLFLLSDA